MDTAEFLRGKGSSKAVIVLIAILSERNPS
jgi:hypothetical protein